VGRWAGKTAKKAMEWGEVSLMFLSQFLEWCDTKEVELFAVTARRIWLRRNSTIHGEKFIHPSQLLREAQTSLEEFRRVNYNAQSESSH
jgi:hypothetical protein